jgi:outer membrane receptor for ferrienterochelin and colicins
MRAHHLFLGTLAALLVRAPAAAADGEDLAGLLNETVVTAATQTAEVSHDAPATSTVITSDALLKYGARTVGEALDLLALGTMSGSDLSAFSDLGARGVSIAGSSGEHFLILVNGVRVNDVVNGAASVGRLSGMPIELIDHIEVILGPGSVLYGSNAMLGVISIVTKEAKAFSGARVGIESEIPTSIRPWLGFGQSFELFGSRGEISTEIEYFKQWGPSLYVEPAYGGIDPATNKPYRYTFSPVGTGVWGGADTSTLSQYEESSMLGRARLGKFELTYDALLGKTPTNVVASDFGTEGHSIYRRLLVDLGYAAQLTSVVFLKAHTFVNAGDTNTTFYSSWEPNCPDPSANCRFNSLLESVVEGVEATPSFDWFKNGTLVTLVGAEAERRSGRSVLNDFNAATGAPVLLSYGVFDHKDVAVAAYAQQTWDPVRWLGLNAAGRLDYDPRFNPVFSPRLALRVDPWSGGTLKAIYSHAFRAPSFYESYFSYPLQPTSVGLRPEYEESFEGSIEQRFAGQKILFGAFATHWTDLISYYQFTAQESAQYVANGKAFLPPAYIERNLSSIKNWGFNAAFEGARVSNAFQYGVNLTAALAFQQQPGAAATPLDVSPRVFGNAHVSYDLPGDLPTIALALSAETARPFQGAFTAGYEPIPYSPPQLIIHPTISGPIPAVRGLSYRVTAFYATTDREPYRIGPALSPSAQNTSPSLVPIDRARAVVSLTYEF